MKHIFHHTAIALLLVADLLVSSCTREVLPGTDTDILTATVSLRIPQLTASTTRAVTDTDKEQAIYTLRVIILSVGAQSINRLFTADDLKNGNDRLTIDNVPVGLVQMYVIANEASIGKDYTSLSDLQADVDQVHNKLLITDTSRLNFPKRGTIFETETTGLPMGWMNKELTINEGTQTIDITLERQVAKLNIEMTNKLDDDITVTSISFGAFHSDRFYFFREQNLDVPDDADYASVTFDQVGNDNNGITIAGGTMQTMVCYVYPSFAWKDAEESSPYTIGFTTEKATYPPQTFVKNYAALNSVIRNTQVNIYATLSKEANVELSYSVEPWKNYTTDVPSFD